MKILTPFRLFFFSLTLITTCPAALCENVYTPRDYPDVRVEKDLRYGERRARPDEGFAYTCGTLTTNEWGFARNGHSTGQDYDLYYPAKHDGALPVFVYIHGGAWCWPYDKADHEEFFEMIANDGWAVFSPDYLLQTDLFNRPNDPVRTEATFDGQLRDIDLFMSEVKRVSAARGFDARRIVIAGESAGGHLCSLYAYDAVSPDHLGLGLKHPLEIGLVFNIVGAIDFTDPNWAPEMVRSMDNSSAHYEKFMAVMTGGLGLSEAEAKYSAVPMISKGCPPHLLSYSCRDNAADDGIIPVTNWERLTNALVRCGIPYSGKLFRGTSHCETMLPPAKEARAWYLAELRRFKNLKDTSSLSGVVPFEDPTQQTPFIERNGIRGWIRGDRTEFAVGETVVFSFTVPTNATKVTLRRFGDDRIEEKVEIGTVTDKGVAYASKLNKPGTVSVELTCDQGSMILGAVFGLDSIRGVTVDRPADFDAYWDGLRAQARAAAKDAKTEPYKNRNDGFTVTAPCGAKMPMTAGYSVPADAAPKSCTALIEFPGYCPTESAGVPPALAGKIWVNFNPHGSPIGRDQEFYNNFAVTNHLQNYGFERDLNEKRETSYFHDMALRLLTTLEYVKTLPQWNGRIEVGGGSQGGFLSLLAASLDPSVKKVNAMMPWLCDFDSERVGYHGGWHPKYTDAMAYYFPLYHVQNIRADEVSLTAGLADTICTPYGIIAVYNELKCPKSIELYQGSGHCAPSKNAKLNVKRQSADASNTAR